MNPTCNYLIMELTNVLVYDMLDDYCMEFAMNEQVKAMWADPRFKLYKTGVSTMNEQTKELAMKYANKMGNSVLHNAEHLEKFAELIVRKCAEIGQQYADGNYEVPNQILEHFGVEE